MIPVSTVTAKAYLPTGVRTNHTSVGAVSVAATTKLKAVTPNPTLKVNVVSVFCILSVS